MIFLFINAFVHLCIWVCVCVPLWKLQDWFSDHLMLNLLPLNWYVKSCLLFGSFREYLFLPCSGKQDYQLVCSSFHSLFPGLHFVNFIPLTESSKPIFLFAPFALSKLVDCHSLFFNCRLFVCFFRQIFFKYMQGSLSPKWLKETVFGTWCNSHHSYSFIIGLTWIPFPFLGWEQCWKMLWLINPYTPQGEGVKVVPPK